MVKLRKSKPSSMWTTAVFSGDSRSPTGGQHGRYLFAQRLGVVPLPGHHENEIIREADKFPGALAVSSAFAPLPVRSHLLAPLLVEMVVQRGQGDIGEQRRENSALRGPGVCLFPVSEFREDPGFQERLH